MKQSKRERERERAREIKNVHTHSYAHISPSDSFPAQLLERVKSEVKGCRDPVMILNSISV